MKKDKVYLSFHKPKSIIGGLVSLWTFGKYSHCEFVINNECYLANVGGGIRKVPFKKKKNIHLFELDPNILKEDILDFFYEVEGKSYDYKGIFGSQFIWFLNSHDEDKYFCSEFCLNAIDYALQFSLTWKLKDLKHKGYHKFSPNRLFDYLNFMELLKDREKDLEFRD